MGESAAILTSCCWTFGSIVFTSAGRKIGSFSVNAYRIVMAIGLLMCAHVVLLGAILPAATGAQWFWMGLSGIVGLGIGDFALFAAYVTIGPRRSVLVMAAAPVFASVGAYAFLGETFSALSIIGVAITLTGIILVLLGREESEDRVAANKRRKQGLLFALVAALGQGFGVVLSKKGMYVDASVVMNPVSAALIRAMLGALFVWVCAVFVGRLPELHNAVRDKDGMKFTAAGAFIGPFVGMTLSMVAVAYTEAGIAQTLMSLMPVIIIPVVWVAYREKTNWRGILGAVIAVIGVALLFLV